MSKLKRLVIAITGASGSIYGQRLLEKLSAFSNDIEEIALIVSETGEQVWKYELATELPKSHLIKQYDNKSFFAPTASGSAGYDAMVVIPCTAGTLGRIASGTSNDLIARSADVMLKERKTLILVLRESPYNLIHIENMRTVTLAGGIIFPASPSFYSKPTNINELIDTVVNRVMEMLGFEAGGYRWGKSIE
jgi:4-hydroxy-3-polyprenylbenzoate decarboxylase